MFIRLNYHEVTTLVDFMTPLDKPDLPIVLTGDELKALGKLRLIKTAMENSYEQKSQKDSFIRAVEAGL